MTKDKFIDQQLRATWQAVAKMYNEEATKYDSTMATAFALLNINYDTGIASTALGPQMGMEATSLSRLLKNMEKKGLIFREKNPKDGRSVLLKLTDLGKTEREISKKHVFQFNDKIKEHISEKEWHIFFKVTDKINQLIIDRLIF